MKIGKLSILWNDPEADRKKQLAEACEKLVDGCNGSIGSTTKAVQDLILRYYDDVRDQSRASFRSAQVLAFLGFVLLVGTVSYLLWMDWMGHTTPPSAFFTRENGMTVGWIGVISGVVVEFIAGTQFLLHWRTTRQFGAFHICLERTHRYLLAYKMAEHIPDKKAPQTLEKIVCIMANAPMISRSDIDGSDPAWFSGFLQKLGTAPSSGTNSPMLVTMTGPHESSSVLVTPSGPEKPNGVSGLAKDKNSV